MKKFNFLTIIFLFCICASSFCLASSYTFTESIDVNDYDYSYFSASAAEILSSNNIDVNDYDYCMFFTLDGGNRGLGVKYWYFSGQDSIDNSALYINSPSVDVEMYPQTNEYFFNTYNSRQYWYLSNFTTADLKGTSVDLSTTTQTVTTQEYPFTSSNGESGDEGNDNITNTSLAEILLSVVVPTGDDWQDLQDTFEDTILSKFHITSMSFNSDLQYNWDDSGLYSPIKSAPTISLGSWGTIDLSGINDLMHTPLSFGIMQVQFGSWEPVDRQVETNGITLYDVVNFLLILDVFICNIILYNKFFNKGGD